MVESVRICFSGSRGYASLWKVDGAVAALPADAVVVHGGARGVDARVDLVARRRGLKVEVVPAQWDDHGRAAGPIRNREMVKSADFVICFWDGASPGTRSTIEAAEEFDVPCKVILDY